MGASHGSELPETEEEPGFLASHQTREATSWAPWIIAAVVIILGLVVLVVAGGHGNSGPQAAGTGMAPADPYAASLALSNLQMSEATSFSGAKVTYIDGQLSNHGNPTLRGTTGVGSPVRLVSR